MQRKRRLGLHLSGRSPGPAAPGQAHAAPCPPMLLPRTQHFTWPLSCDEDRPLVCPQTCLLVLVSSPPSLTSCRPQFHSPRRPPIQQPAVSHRLHFRCGRLEEGPFPPSKAVRLPTSQRVSLRGALVYKKIARPALGSRPRAGPEPPPGTRGELRSLLGAVGAGAKPESARDGEWAANTAEREVRWAVPALRYGKSRKPSLPE